MRAAYTGHEALTFNDYVDLDSGQTLTAEPGGVYDIAPASGHAVPDVPEAWFAPVTDEEPEGDADPEPGTGEGGSGED